MSFSLYVSKLSTEQVAFGYSAAHETLIALHVFFDCQHHPLHIPWVIQARKKISPALKEEIEHFSIFYKRPIVSFWNLQENSVLRSFENDLDDFLKKPSQFYRKTIVETILNCEDSDHVDKQEFLDIASKRYPSSKGVVFQLLENPDESRQRFITMLEAFWDSCVKDMWPMMEELFLKDIHFRGEKLLTEGPLHLLASLSKEIDLFPDEERVVIRRISKEDIHFDDKDVLFLAPTYFAWPHLFVKRPKPIGINYSIMEHQLEGARPMPPEDLLAFFRAMGDFTRLQIVKCLAQKPRSTRELAQLIGVTEGAVSKHLKQLADSGLVGSRRESYYVFYHLLEKPFHDFPIGLREFLK